jgi:uncharacterized protein (DUF2252 family)
MLTVDPLRLAHRQIAIDGKRMKAYPDLLAHKAIRMSASPLALLRGSAPLFYELLERHPALAEGPRGEGWLVGDAHLENFGAYRPGALSLEETSKSRASERIAFDLNDFDDACVGPWRFDVLRLVTSLILGGREMGADGPVTLELCDTLLTAYTDAVFHDRKAPAPPKVIAALVNKVQSRTREQLLDARTQVVRGG